MSTAVRSQGESHSLPTKTSTMADNDDHIDIDALLSRPRFTGRRRLQGPLYKAPEFVKRLNSFEEVTVGKDVVFECQWKAFPKPDVRWFRDDEEITHSPRYLTREDNGMLSLLIRKVTKADEGAYKCRAENQEGTGSTTGYLSVKGERKDKVLSAQPRMHAEHAVSYPPNLRTITEQQSVEEREEGDYEPLFPPNWPGGLSFPHNNTGYTLPGSRRDDTLCQDDTCDAGRSFTNGDQSAGPREAPLADEEDLLSDDLMSSSTDHDVFQLDDISDDEGSLTPDEGSFSPNEDFFTPEPITPPAVTSSQPPRFNTPTFHPPTPPSMPYLDSFQPLSPPLISGPTVASPVTILPAVMLKSPNSLSKDKTPTTITVNKPQARPQLTTCPVSLPAVANGSNTSNGGQIKQSNSSTIHDNRYKPTTHPPCTVIDPDSLRNTSECLASTSEPPPSADLSESLPWAWYIFFIVCCAFWGNFTHMNPVWFVCYVAFLCFVSFIFTLSPKDS